MSTETVGEKAERLLSEGRLTITRVSTAAELQRARIVATCRGDHGDYVLGFDAEAREWRCTCQSRHECAHLIALKLVTKGDGGATL